MKKVIISLSMLIILIFGMNQIKSQIKLSENEAELIYFTGVVTTSNQLTESQIFDNFKTWFLTKSSNFNRSNPEKNYQGLLGPELKQNFAQIDALYKNDVPLKLSDKESFRLIGKIVNKYTGEAIQCCRIIYLEYDLIINIKDNKYKYELTNFTYTHYNSATGEQSQIFGLKDEGPCKSKGNLGELLECENCKNSIEKLFNYLINDINSFLEDMKANIDIKQTEDTW